VAALLEKLQEALAGRYEVERELGRGGSATVFLARDLKHPREVAIKVLDPEVARVVGRERFLREIEITASLTHPHILPVFDSGSIDDCLFYVMPYVKGESLRSRLERQGRLPVDEALQVAREVADALAYAHRNEVLHRDIKPANILLEEGHAVVADFGIARAIHAAGAATLTETGMIVGTPAYMSPEQVSGRGTLDGRSDLYSLGCVLYEMLAGAPPFRADTPLAYAHQHVEATPRALAELCPDVSHGVSQVLARVLAKRPEERFATADEFAQALAAPGALAKRAPWRSRRAAAAAAIVIGLAVVGTWWALRPPRGKAPPPPAKPEWILVADFEGPADDPELARAVRELVRVDLDQSSVVQTVPRDQIQMALALAQKPETTRVTEALARELAYRNEIGAVLSGSVLRVGTGFSVILRIIDPASSASLISLSRSADNENALIPTAGELARGLLIGLRTKHPAIRTTNSPLQGVTASFEAFRRYREAYALNDLRRSREAIPVFGEALRLDRDFALAWLELGITYSNLGVADSALFAYSEAQKRSQRLVGAARFILDAQIAWANLDLAGAVRGYSRLLENYPGHIDALNNRGVILTEMGFFEDALQDLQRAVDISPVDAQPMVRFNLVFTSTIIPRVSVAEKAAARLDGLYRDLARLAIEVASDDWARVESLAIVVGRQPTPEAELRASAALALVGARATRGAAQDARRSLRQAEAATETLGVPRWIHLARRLGLCLEIALPDGVRSPPSRVVQDRSVSSLVTLGMLRASAGDIRGAQQYLRSVRARSQAQLDRYGSAPTLLDAWIARGRTQWQQVITKLAPLGQKGGELGPHVPEDGAGRILCRWLVAEAYEHLDRPDSAARYYEWVLSPRQLFFDERLQRAVFCVFAHQRLVVLYAGMGRHDKAREHWRLLSATCTRPDPPVRQLLAEAKTMVSSP
jgi:tetratricopeptide (TPR) repeat protein